MNTMLRLLAGFSLATVCLNAADPTPAENQTADAAPDAATQAKIAEAISAANSLKYQEGNIDLYNGMAHINLPSGYRYLDAADTETLLTKLWGNPNGDDTLGMIVPTGFSPFADDSWAVVISYSEDGYVKDDEASSIDYNQLLQQMKDSTRADSEERVKQGFESVELIGWAAPPHYDASDHKLYWAREIKFGDTPDHVLNYDIRMLGRRGVLVLKAVADMSSLPQVEAATPELLKMVDFNSGHRYADFDGSTDKVATYGLAALVAGGIAAKAGFFKLLWVGILAAKKFILIGLAAGLAFLKKFWAKIRGRPGPAAAASSDGPSPGVP